MHWVCRSCTAVYSVGAPCCPQCGADDHYDLGDEEEKPQVVVSKTKRSANG